MTDDDGDDGEIPGRGVIQADWIGTTLFIAGAVAAAAAPDDLGVVTAGIDLVLFALGSVAVLVAFFRVVGRSRTEEISVVGVYFLAGGSAPACSWPGPWPAPSPPTRSAASRPASTSPSSPWAASPSWPRSSAS